MEKMPELMRLLRTKSTMRYFPPKGTAGLERSRVRGNKRLPLPPARTNATILRRILTSSLDLSRSECRRGCTTQHSKHMVEGILRTNSGFIHDGHPSKSVDRSRNGYFLGRSRRGSGPNACCLQSDAANKVFRLPGSQGRQRCASGPPGG